MSKTYISLFSSAGVGCYGFKMAGYDCIATNELIEKCLDVQRYNKKCKYQSGYIQGDILKPETKLLIFNEIELWRSKEKLDEVTVIIATPPCQGMSVANHKKKDEGGRNSLVVESLKLISEIKPKFFVLENVRAFLNTICTDADGKNKAIKNAIIAQLGETYQIGYRVLNFKNHGSNSSRTRTLVIGVRKDIEINPESLFPQERDEVTLRKVIGHLPSLKAMGEIYDADIYHSFRKYAPEMRRWIELLKEGEGAFNNTDPSRLPHYYRKGEKIQSKNGNADKYTRQYWDKPAPCIHTRSDILASQNTVHPVDDRVFSVHELMLMMTIPQEFQWSAQTLEELNRLPLAQKAQYIARKATSMT
jgi:DNA (cytosine-5)-methyltransferase 1